MITSFFAKINIFKSMTGKNVLDEAIKKIVYILVVLIPIWFLPTTINVLELNKQFLIVVLSIIALILWLVKILNTGELRIKNNIINFTLAAFLLVAILSTIFSVQAYGSLIGSENNLNFSLISIFSFIALAFLIVNNFKDIKEKFGLLFAFLISAAIACVYGFLQLWGGFIFSWEFAKNAAFNTVGSVNSFGIFSVITLIIVSALLFVVKNKGIKIFFSLLALLNLITIISINFLTLWIILAAGIFVLLLLALGHIIYLGRSVSWIALPMILLGLSLIFIFFRPNLSLGPQLSTEVGLSHKGSFSVVLNTIKQKPILGSGPETFAFNYAKYKPEIINQTAFWNVSFSNPAGEIYAMISDFGILGTISFVAILIVFVMGVIKNIINGKEDDVFKKFLNVGILSGWFAILVGWFLYPQSIVLTFVFWLLLAIYLIDNNIKEERIYNLRKNQKTLLISSLCFVVVIVLVIGLLYVSGTRYIADIIYGRGINLVQVDGDLNNGINKIVKATVVNPYQDNNYRALSQLFTIKLQQDALNEDLTQEEKSSLIQEDAINAINAATRTTTLSPRNASNWLLRGQVYRNLAGIVDGATDWAKTSYEEAIKLEPLNPFIYLELGRLYINQADLIAEQAKKDQGAQKTWEEYMSKAIKNTDKAIELKANYSDAYYTQAQIYDRQGKITEAIRKLEINKQLLPNDKNVAFQLAVLYYRAELFKKAKAEFIRAIVLDDNFSNARYFLGLLYDWEGSKEDAIDQFERIAQLNPDNEQVQDILANIRTGKPALGKAISAKSPADLLIEEQPINQ